MVLLNTYLTWGMNNNQLITNNMCCVHDNNDDDSPSAEVKSCRSSILFCNKLGFPLSSAVTHIHPFCFFSHTISAAICIIFRFTFHKRVASSIVYFHHSKVFYLWKLYKAYCEQRSVLRSLIWVLYYMMIRFCLLSWI